MMPTTFLIGAILLAAYMAATAVRVFIGPTIPDRAVALDTINTLVVSAMVLLGAYYRQVIYIDIAVVYALLSFAETLFIAKYIESEVRCR